MHPVKCALTAPLEPSLRLHLKTCLPWRVTEPHTGTNCANHAHHEAQIVITSLQGVADKEAIVQELVGARRILYASPRGTAVRLFPGSLYLPPPTDPLHSMHSLVSASLAEC